MQTSLYSPPSHFARQPSLPGQRHWGGLSILALSSPSDARGARAEPAADAAAAAARVQAYPSPPMSGSPPLPPKPSLEAGEQHSEGRRSYPATGYDAYRGGAAAPTATPPTAAAPATAAAAGPALPRDADYARHHPDAAQPYGFPPHHPRQQQQHPLSLLPPHHAPAYPPEPQDRLPYPGYGRADEAGFPPPLAALPGSSYPPPQPPHQQAMTGYSSYLPQLPGPASMQQGYPPTCLPPAPSQQLPSPVAGSSMVDPEGSPKTQRKTKGHVASACVPCKRAHLRCDAQRPCSRCLSNGKESACIDVQHKKRGRPRLREDRDLGYDFSGRGLSAGGHPTEASGHRSMPLLYGPPAMGSGYHHLERAMGADAGGGGGGGGYAVAVSALSAGPPPPEPAAFLTMDLEIGNASSAFSEAIGRAVSTTGALHILDVVAPAERDRVLALQRQMQGARQRKDPQYLPPIFAQRDEQRVLRAQGFAPQDLARFALDWHEFFTFVAADGQQRTFPVRLGLAKQDSIYFIVLLLQVAVRPPPPPPPPPPSRDYPSYAYPQQQQQQSIYAQPPPVSAPFDAGRPLRVSEAAGLVPPSSHRPPSASYGPPPAPGRPEYGAGGAGAPHPYPTPRGEPATMGPLSHRQRQQQQQQQQEQPGGDSSPFYQLPPIRSQQHEPPPPPPPPPRDDTSRVDIGGLIDRPESPRRP